MAISDSDLVDALSEYLDRHPGEAELLSDPMRLLTEGEGFASRWNYRMHVTAGALLVRNSAEVLLVEHRAYGIPLQPGGHLEPTDASLIDAALRELTEETGIDPGSVIAASRASIYIEYGQVPARPEKGEPAHHHLDFGFAFATTDGEIGRLQESEVTGAAWYPLAEAERVVGRRIARAVSP